MRYKVPQNIDMQDRIIGPLTMLQFLYAVIGGGFCYGIIMSGMPKVLAFIIAIPVGLFVAAMIFLKINERPFLDFFLSVLEYSSAPKQRLWHHENSADLNVEIYKPKVTSKITMTPAKNYSRQDIKDLANKIDPQQK